jgi:hypothetical protein
LQEHLRNIVAYKGGIGKGNLCPCNFHSVDPSCLGPLHVPRKEALCLTTHCVARVIRPPCRRECGCLRGGKLKASKKLEKKGRRQRPILRRQSGKRAHLLLGLHGLLHGLLGGRGLSRGMGLHRLTVGDNDLVREVVTRSQAQEGRDVHQVHVLQNCRMQDLRSSRKDKI